MLKEPVKKMSNVILKIALVVVLSILSVECGICPNNCSKHGKCTPNGCECYVSNMFTGGYTGGDCSQSIVVIFNIK